MILGAILSTTVTVALHVDELPHASVTVSVTLFAPTFEQSNEVLDAPNVIDPPQLSYEPLLMSAQVIVALPELFRYTVLALHIAVGAMLSLT